MSGRTILYVQTGQKSFRYARTHALVHFFDYARFFRQNYPQYKSDDKNFAKLLSAAITRVARGDVKLMSPADGVHMVTRSVLIEIEWPELMQNERITSVTWIDPDDTVNQLVIWKASQGPIDFPYNTAMSTMAAEAAKFP